VECHPHPTAAAVFRDRPDKCSLLRVSILQPAVAATEITVRIHHATTAAATIRVEDILRAVGRMVADRITADRMAADRTEEVHAAATVAADHMDRVVVVIHPAAAEVGTVPAVVEDMVAAVIAKLQNNN
jgi:hypothetical protein